MALFGTIRQFYRKTYLGSRTPLAWHNLTFDRRRFVVALAGVAFAVLLMFIFNGFKNALYDSQVQLHKALNGEIDVKELVARVNVTDRL